MRRNLVAAVLVVLVAAFLLNAWTTGPTVVDDAWITARYARSLAMGHGPVYNAGQPPVEGYTNLALVLVEAAGYRLGLDLHLVMLAQGLLFGAAGLVGAFFLARRLQGDHGSEDLRNGLALIPPAFLAIDAHYAVICTNGIESGMWVAGVLWACAAALHAGDLTGPRRWAVGAAISTLIAVRPEGIAVIGALVLHDLFRERTRLTSPSAWGLAVPAAAMAAAVWGSRLWYFGEFVPNTFSAKNHRDLADQLSFNMKFFEPDAPFWVLCAVILAIGLGTRFREVERIAVGVVAVGLLVVGLSVDEWMPGGRLYIATAGLSLCLAVAALAPMAARDFRAAVAVAGLVIAPVAIGPIPQHVRAYDGRHSMLPDNPASLAAKFVGDHLPPGSVVATRDAGVLAYFFGDHVLIDELHPRALTQPHPDGKDLAVGKLVPKNPEVFVATVQREHEERFRYDTDLTVWRRMDVEYRYLGRVYQHFHRYYDFYVRADLDVPDLPPEWVTNREGPAKPPGLEKKGKKEAPVLTITSPDFADISVSAEKAEIPKIHTCEGEDRQPTVRIANVPEGTKSLALVVDDPDAPDPAAPKVDWIHWVVVDLPPDTKELAPGAALPAGARDGQNGWKDAGWRGPCPPIGRHRYIFTVYALDTALPDLNKPTQEELLQAIDGHVLEKATLTGTYQKSGAKPL